MNPQQLSRIAHLICDRFGLHSETNRQTVLSIKLTKLSKDLGFDGIDDFEEALINDRLTEQQRSTLAKHFTVGETFFFREVDTFNLFRELIMPEVIRQKETKHLRIMSAGCSTGEEPYSIAILLDKHFRHLTEWSIEILALDINDEHIKKARDGVYRGWSFRGAPEWLKREYFIKRAKDEYELRDDIKSKVNFMEFDLVANQSDFAMRFKGFDVIFCRNVVMYFNEEIRQRTSKMFFEALNRPGWLLVSTVEASSQVFTDFERSNYNRVTYFFKPTENTQRATLKDSSSEASAASPCKGSLAKPQLQDLKALTKKESKHSKNISDNQQRPLKNRRLDKRAGKPEDNPSTDVHVNLDSARQLADFGRLDEALSVIEEILKQDRLVKEAYYLKALICEEKGDLQTAEEALKTVLYLDGESVSAHFRIGGIYLKTHRKGEALREFKTVVELLNNKRQRQPLEIDLDGLNVSRLEELSKAMIKELEMA